MGKIICSPSAQENLSGEWFAGMIWTLVFSLVSYAALSNIVLWAWVPTRSKPPLFMYSEVRAFVIDLPYRRAIGCVDDTMGDTRQI